MLGTEECVEFNASNSTRSVGQQMMGEDIFHQVKEMFATFKADILSDYKEGLREASEQIEQARLSRELLT